MAFPSDEAVMQAIQGGHLDLLGTLFTRYAGRVFGRCFQMVGDRHAADDLVQESFLRVLRYRSSFKGTARFSTWLYRIATNVCLDHLKAKGRDGEVARDLASTASDFAPPMVAPEGARVALLREAFDRLPEERRELLIACRVRGVGYAQLAAQHGVSEGAVRVRVHRAVRELRAIVDSLQEAER